MNTSDFILDLKRMLENQGITQQKLASLSGISQGSICKIANGKTSLRFSTVITLWPHIYGAPFPEKASAQTPQPREDA